MDRLFPQWNYTGRVRDKWILGGRPNVPKASPG